LTRLAENPKTLAPIKEFADSTLDALNSIFKLWDTALQSSGGVYYNLPVRGEKGVKGVFKIDRAAHEDNLKNLYVDMAPEGPYFLLETDFSEPSTIATPVAPVTPAPSPAPVITPAPIIAPGTQQIAGDLKMMNSVHPNYSPIMDISTLSLNKQKTIAETLSAIQNHLNDATSDDDFTLVTNLKNAFELTKSLINEKTNKDAHMVLNKLIDLFSADPDDLSLELVILFRELTPNKMYQILFKDSLQTGTFDANNAKDLLDSYIMDNFISNPSLLGSLMGIPETFTTKC
jgi:hypothetical protein